jgi:hypothetical protein
MQLRRSLPILGLVSGLLLLLPATALAAKPTPTPVPTTRPQASPTAPPATPTVPPPTPTAQPTTVPATPTPLPTASPVAAPAAADATDTAEPNTAANPAPADAAAAPAAAGPATPPTPTPAATETIPDDAFTIWHGVVRQGGAYRRAAPSSGAEIIEELEPGTPIRVDRWVGGSMLYPDVITWAVVDPEDGGGYIFGGSLAGILPPEAPPPPAAMEGSAGTWIDVNLTLNVVTAYQDGAPVRSMLTSPGRPGYETDTGLFSVRSKLLSQTMTGPDYSVPNVPHVQYFYGAEALHGRYWTLPDVLGQTSATVDDDGQIEVLDEDTAVDTGGVNRGVAFGVPSSHGCLGLDVESATWLYSLTLYGTPVDVHY